MSVPAWTVTISGTAVSIFQNVIQIKRTIDNGRTCKFTVRDTTGLIDYTKNQPVVVTDDSAVVRFTGFIHTAKRQNLNPNTTNLIDIDCMDQKWLADKAYVRTDYQQEYSGDIVADLHTNQLAQLGITAAYAMRRDASAVQFGLGTVTNTVGSTNIGDGDLELKPAGSTVTVTETTTSDFAAGTLTNTTASSNALRLSSVQALQMVATSQQGANNNYTYLKIWSGSYTIATGDQFVYTIWISSSSPKPTGGLDLSFSDGTAARNLNIFDQNGLFANPSSDLSGYGVDKWYTRSFGLSGDAGGKTLNYMTIAQEGDPSGMYTFYVRDAKILDSSNTLKVQLMANGTPSRTPTQLSDLGYSNVVLKTITAYIDSGTRISPSRNITATGIVRSSLVSWSLALQDSAGNVSTIANDAQGPNKINYCTVESSIDGGTTWQSVSNHGVIAGLLAGANAVSLSLLFRETLRVAGPDPTIAPILTDVTMTVTPSYTATVSNNLQSVNSTNWTSLGTYSNTMTGYFGDLNINGAYRNWATDPLPYANTTLLSSGLATSNVYQPNSCLQIRADGSTDIRARLDDVGAWGDCTIECDVLLVDAVGNYGLCYRGAGNNTNNTYAYLAYIDSGSVALARGSNGGTGSYTVVVSVALTLALGQWYHLKIQATGSTHKIYINDVLYITQTDATYTAAGTIALRHYNSNAVGGSSNRHSGFFQNFGVVYSQTGTWVSTAVSLSSLGNFGSSIVQWNDTTPTNATLLIETSIDSGSTWQTATNGLAVPNATIGASTSGKALSLRATLSTQNANITPALHGISVLVLSAYSASGSRVSPALLLNAAGTAGSTSITWNALVPTNTTLGVDSSLNGTTWTAVGSGASGSVAIPGVTLGSSVVGTNVYTRARLASTDPTVTPQLEDITVSVRSPSIQTGAFIPDTQYSIYSGNKITIGAALDDLAKKSGYVWDIQQNALTFLNPMGVAAPWAITGNDMMEKATVTVETSGDSYRNVQFITGLTSSLARVEPFLPDGITQTWPVAYAIQSVTSIMLNGTVYSVGVLGVDTGKSFYYKVGDTVFSQDTSLTPPDSTQTGLISYTGLSTNVSVEVRNTAQIATIASIDGTDGIVEASEDATGLQNLAGMQLAASRLDQYAVIAHTLTFTTARSGLMPAMLASVTLPQFNLSGASFLITEVDTTVDATAVVEHAVKATDGSDVTTWGRYLLDQRKAV